jgi:excisionase family DNA binding protein
MSNTEAPRPIEPPEPLPTPIFDPSTDELYSTTKVAQIFDVKPETVRDWIRTGKIEAVRLASGHHRIKRSVVMAFANHKFGAA